MKRTVLIVDDEKLNREAIKKILNGEYKILEAENGREALSVMESCAGISAVLLDLFMPVMYGFALLSWMCMNEDGKKLPVVAMTGQTGVDSEARALGLGADDYITKPYNATVVRQRLRNVIRLREAAATVSELQRDRLTGLYSRSAFFEKAAAMIAEKEPGYYVLACFDIDNFKVINDQYGTDRGDQVLRFLADLFQRGFEAEGGICCRMMADNFAVLYPRSVMDSERINELRRRAAGLDGAMQPISFSIGRYIIDDTTLSVSSMYDRAAMAEASIKGRYDRNVAMFDESMRDNLLAEQRIVNEMKNALEQGQFEPWFQPQYDHSTGKLIGAEALARWRHPQSGLIPPSVFIPVFEKNGFIYELDKCIWERVCALLRKWIDEGRNPLPVSVNISRCDVFRDDLIDVLSGLISRYDLPVGLLRLEITESAFSQNTAQIVQTVKRLIGMGFAVEIDDFGSGYSSLNTLKDVPAQIIKLDMRFLEDSGESRRGGNLLESVVRMAKWLDMSVIAEDVETKQQADFLKSVGCFFVQGYLYAKPMPVEEYEALAGKSVKLREIPVLETVENLDNNAFWSPESMDTLIFNSYLGGACILEYANGKIELLRANDKYIQVIGSAGMTLNDAFRLDWIEYMDEKSRGEMDAVLRQAASAGTESTFEFVFNNLPGCAEKTYLRCTMRVIAKVDKRLLIYCTNENITAQRIAEQKRQETMEQLAFLEGIAHELLTVSDAEAGIGTLLDKLLNYFDGNRCYIFEFDFPNGTADNTYEQCAHGVTPEKDRLQRVPMEAAPYWLHAFDRQDFIDIEDVSTLGEEREDRELLESQGIRSLVAVPLRRDGVLIGFIGVDDPRRNHKKIQSLSAVGDYAVVLLTRRDMDGEIRNENQEKLALMDGIPGGFVRMQVRPDGTAFPMYHSEGFQKLVNMDQKELDELYGSSAMAGVHPEDKDIVQDALKLMLNSGEAHNVRYRLKRGGGGYVWVSIFGKMRQSRSGQTYLNVYYTEAEKEKSLENVRKELLDNLPCGAALYELHGTSLSVIHLNRHYWELVGRPPRKCEDIDVLSAVYPEDRHIIPEEIAAAIRQNRGTSCDVRILCGDSGYRMFHISGRIVARENGRQFLCATYTPVSDETGRMQEMLPVALSAIMKSTSDLCFVKDKDLRYICGSNTFAKLAGLESAQDLPGKTDYDLFDRETADKYRRDDELLLSSSKPIVDMLEEIPSTDGIAHSSSTSKYLLRDSGGNVIGIYGSGRDVTKYRNFSDWMELLAENIPGGIASYGYEQGRIKLLYFNDGLCRLFGLTREEYGRECAENPMRHVVEEDMPKLREQADRILNGASDAECVLRVRSADGERKWVSLRAAATQRHRGAVIANAILADVTEQETIMEKLRTKEEEYRLAMQHTGNTICRFTVADRTLTMTPDVAAERGLPESVADMPEGMLRMDVISPESRQAYADFYRAIMRGEKTGRTIFRCRMPVGMRWLEAHFSSVFSDGQPVFAVISYSDITERQEKELVYNKWRQSLRGKSQDDYTLFRCNLSKDTTMDTQEGNLMRLRFDENKVTFNERTEFYLQNFVLEEDKADYAALLNSDTLLAGYYRGVRYRTAEYREKLPDGGVRWLKVTIELVEYPNSSDIEAYLMYENIDEEKKLALQIRANAETDSLTGIMNRATFAKKADELIAGQRPGALCALFIIDVDDFKLINDRFGHAAGDKALAEVGQRLQSLLRPGDLVGRLGGDEFVILLCDMPGREVVSRWAELLCAKMRDHFDSGVSLAASIGIAICPDDGRDLDELYHKADAAMYHAKGTGKDHHAVYSDDMRLVR